MILRHFLKSKLQEVIVTQANIEYEGSITIDQDLMDAANLYQYERVEVNGKTSKSRIATYVIAGERGSGIIALNGGAALHFQVGDQVHILSYCLSDSGCIINPIVVHTVNNRLK
ncbi:MAG: aspartate 1-decarboxylase [Bacteroidales bacterium]|nr:aspartate 1-decarboxylase [Bacteroidales bacterium]